jgi:hypothetical protein
LFLKGGAVRFNHSEKAFLFLHQKKVMTAIQSLHASFYIRFVEILLKE